MQKQLDSQASEPKVWDISPYFNQDLSTPKKNNEVNVTYDVLRKFSVYYPVARSCINFRKTQITQLDWAVVRSDGEEAQSNITAPLEQFFKRPYGESSRLRKMLDIMVEDLMVIDAVSLYKERTVANKLAGLIPIDPTTIKVKVDAQGRTPEPPEVAYIQVIGGRVVAEMTTDDLLYDFLNSRSNSPYGLSPLESLIQTVTTALNLGSYNAEYLRSGNIPEGFIELKETMASKPEQVKEWQNWFDALLSGRSRRLKVVPEGANYTPTKKPEDMSFERFELWLLQLTCAVFGVPPEEIGFTSDTNRATADSQKEAGIARGLKPLAGFIEEVFTNIIQDEFGYTDLEFRFTNLDPADEQAEILKLEKDIKLGIRSVDEERVARGLDPIGLGHYVEGNVKSVDQILNPQNYMPTFPTPPQDNTQDKTEPDQDEEDTQKLAKADLLKWRNKCMADIKRGRAEFRGFVSDYVPDDIQEEIEDQLVFTTTKDGVWRVFDRYLSTEGELLNKTEILLNEIRSLRQSN